MLVIQAFSQLREIYGQQNAETMMKSLAARIVYAPKDIAEATEISNELGFTTVKVQYALETGLNCRGLQRSAAPQRQRERTKATPAVAARGQGTR